MLRSVSNHRLGHARLRYSAPTKQAILAGRQQVLTESAMPGPNVFGLYFALPRMLFRFGTNTPLLERLYLSLLRPWLGCALLLILFTISFSLLARAFDVQPTR